MASVNARNRIRVLARFRPLSPAEEEACGADKQVQFGNNNKSVGIQGQIFSFDRVFDPTATQQNVFEFAGQPICADFVKGFNGSILCYGQTGAGKTHTMHGFGASDGLGLVHKCISTVYEHVDSIEDAPKPEISISFYEIYLEKVHDLLDVTKSNLRVRAHPTHGVFVEDLTEKIVKTCQEAMNYVQMGLTNRTTQATKMNVDSSRSHAICTLKMNTTNADGSITRSSLLLVDLAGSESGADTGLGMEQQKKINLSLTSLGKVIWALTENGKPTDSPSHCMSSPAFSDKLNMEENANVASPEPSKADRRLFYISSLNHRSSAGDSSLSSPSRLAGSSTTSTPVRSTYIPYRDSKLTRLLSNALGGNARTCLILCASPSLKNETETLSTMRFGQRAKLIKNDVSINRFNSTMQLSLNNESQLNLQLGNIQKELDSLREERSASSMEYELALTELSSAKQSLADLTSERDNLREANSRLTTNLQEKENALQLESKVNSITEMQHTMVVSMKRKHQLQIEALEDMVDELRLQVQGLQARERYRQHELEQQSSLLLESMTKQNEEMFLSMETLKTQNEALELICQQKDAHIANLERLLQEYQCK